MRFSNTVSALSAAVFSALAVMTAQAADAPQTETAAPAAPEAQQTVKPSPSSMASKQLGNMKITRRVDGAVMISGKLHGGKGVPADIVIPKVVPDIRMVGPDVIDENGRRISESRMRARKMADLIVFQGLKAQGYDFEAKKRENAGKETQVDRWKRQSQEVLEYEKVHGPITSKRFLMPGAPPDTDTILQNPETSVRVEDGKLVYYLHGRRITTDGSQLEKPKKKEDVSYAPTTETLKLRVVKRPGGDPKKLEAEKAAAKAPVKQAVKSSGKESPMATAPEEHEIKPGQGVMPKRPAVPKIRRKAPKKAYQPNPEEDLRRSPTDVEIDTKKLPGPDDVERQLREAFPDMVPSSRTTSSAETLFMTILGIGSAEAAERPFRPDDTAEVVKRIAAERNTLIKGVQAPNDTQTDPAKDAARRAAEAASKAADIATGQGKHLDAAMSAILEAEPQIRQVLPDADKRLQKRKAARAASAAMPVTGEHTYVFLSYSLDDMILVDTLERHAGRTDVTFVMRGVPEGMTIPDGIRRIQMLASEVKDAPGIVIDPPLFTHYGITQVPAVVRTGPIPPSFVQGTTSGGAPGRAYAEMLAKVTGLNNDRWLIERLDNGEKGDLGVQGTTYAILEADIMEVMKSEVAKVDWEKKKKDDAAKRYWETRTFSPYPTAGKHRRRVIDPTIIMTEDMTDALGKVIRAKGERINPLDVRPFTQIMMIFNPLSSEELSRVDAYLAKLTDTERMKLVMIATAADKKAGWEGYKALTDRFDAHVYIITPEVEREWQIERTPSVVTADNKAKRFIVEELGPAEEEEGKK